MNETNLSADQQKDVEERIKAFDIAYEEICKKFQVSHSIFPQLVPLQPGVFVTIANGTVVDRKYASVPSPIQMGNLGASGGGIIEK